METQNFCADCTLPHEEIWKDISGYEGLYQISNLGRVKSLARKMWNGKGYFISKERIRIAHNNKHGYLCLKLSKDNIDTCFKLHRLVAKAFIPNTEGNNIVNHKNGIKTDNRVENLEWVTQQENCLHAYKNHLSTPVTKPRKTLRKYSNEQVKEIKKLRKQGNSCDKIAQLLNLPRGFVNKVIYGKIYKEVA